jgi:hypothetical protein
MWSRSKRVSARDLLAALSGQFAGFGVTEKFRLKDMRLTASQAKAKAMRRYPLRDSASLVTCSELPNV